MWVAVESKAEVYEFATSCYFSSCVLFTLFRILDFASITYFHSYEVDETLF